MFVFWLFDLEKFDCNYWGENSSWDGMFFVSFFWMCFSLVHVCQRLQETKRKVKRLAVTWILFVLTLGDYPRTNSNRVCDSLNCNRFLRWTWASLRNKVAATRVKTVPTQARTKDQPNQLFACSGIQPFRLPKQANTMTAMAALTPEPRSTYPTDRIKVIKYFWSGPAHRKYTRTPIALRSIPIKARV